jgi:hypothetical protein
MLEKRKLRFTTFGGASAVIETIFSPLMMTMPRALLISFSGSPRRLGREKLCDTLLFGLYSSEFFAFT